MMLAIYDIDGTLISLPETDVTSDDFNWKTWLNNSWKESKKHQAVAEQFAMDLDSKLTDVWVVTARPEQYRKDTELQLMNLGLWDHRFRLVMRPDDECVIEADVITKLKSCTFKTETDLEDSIKSLLHNGHAKYRTRAVEALRVLYGERFNRDLRAYDDQMKNLEVWKENHGRCFLVDEKGDINNV